MEMLVAILADHIFAIHNHHITIPQFLSFLQSTLEYKIIKDLKDNLIILQRIRKLMLQLTKSLSKHDFSVQFVFKITKLLSK